MLSIGVGSSIQIMITISNFAASLVNYLASKFEGGWGWCVSLVMTVVPAGIITIGSLHLPVKSESPLMHSLLEKNYVRDDSEAQNDILIALIDAFVTTKHHWSSILQHKYIPHITMDILIPFFQQLTNINFFIALFFLETRNVPVEKMPRVWKAYWFWRKFVPEHVGG